MHLTQTPRDASSRTAPRTLDANELRLLDAYWRAANYLSVGQISLRAKADVVRVYLPPDTNCRSGSTWMYVEAPGDDMPDVRDWRWSTIS